MNPEKRKTNSAKRTPPLHPPQSEFGLCRLGNTDFQDKSEFASFQNIGPLPADLGKRLCEFKNDMNIIKEEMELLGFKKGSIEMARVLVRMARELP
jgi:hypothetical protein